MQLHFKGRRLLLTSLYIYIYVFQNLIYSFITSHQDHHPACVSRPHIHAKKGIINRKSKNTEKNKINHR